ncbi:MAG: hypothetical protein U1F53_01850 [Burkholderiaceae bacterium]
MRLFPEAVRTLERAIAELTAWPATPRDQASRWAALMEAATTAGPTRSSAGTSRLAFYGAEDSGR